MVQKAANGQLVKANISLNCTRKKVVATRHKQARKLIEWGKQKWRTKSGKKSSETGERYLPEKAIKALTPAQYAATTRAKRLAKKKGEQYAKQPSKIMKKTRRFT